MAGIEPTTFVNFWNGKNISGVGSLFYERPYVWNVAEKASEIGHVKEGLQSVM